MSFSKFADWITIFGLIIAVWFYFKQKSKSDGQDVKLDKILEAIKNFQETKEHGSKGKEVPAKIEFSSKLLIVPGLEELGIPIPFAHIPYIVPHVKYGDWVKRGDKLITVSFESFRQATPPNLIKRILFDDKKSVESYDICSPISGLVVNLRNTRSRTVTAGPGGVLNGIIMKELRLPNILIPSHEPDWDGYDLSRVRESIFNFVHRNWRVNVHNIGGDYSSGKAYEKVRLGEGVSQYGVFSDKLVEVDDVETLFLNNDAGSVDWEIIEYADYSKKDDWVDTYINDLRVNDEALYDKLKHLVENPKLADRN